MTTEKRLIEDNSPWIKKHFTKRLVDVFTLIETIEDITWYHVNDAGRLVEGANSSRDIPLFKANDIFSALGSAPTVDAVEVVRCKDCKHREHYDALLYCGHVRGLAGSVSPDDFCSYGERKDNDLA